jgi:hypothetical protein
LLIRALCDHPVTVRSQIEGRLHRRHSLRTARRRLVSAPTLLGEISDWVESNPDGDVVERFDFLDLTTSAATGRPCFYDDDVPW